LKLTKWIRLALHCSALTPVAESFRGAMGLYEETEALGMRSRFQEIWTASYPGVASTTVGL